MASEIMKIYPFIPEILEEEEFSPVYFEYTPPSGLHPVFDSSRLHRQMVRYHQKFITVTIMENFNLYDLPPVLFFEVDLETADIALAWNCYFDEITDTARLNYE